MASERGDIGAKVHETAAQGEGEVAIASSRLVPVDVDSLVTYTWGTYKAAFTKRLQVTISSSLLADTHLLEPLCGYYLTDGNIKFSNLWPDEESFPYMSFGQLRITLFRFVPFTSIIDLNDNEFTQRIQEESFPVPLIATSHEDVVQAIHKRGVGINSFLEKVYKRVVFFTPSQLSASSPLLKLGTQRDPLLTRGTFQMFVLQITTRMWLKPRMSYIIYHALKRRRCVGIPPYLTIRNVAIFSSMSLLPRLFFTHEHA